LIRALTNRGFAGVRNFLLLGVIAISMIACSESKPEMLEKRELRELMISSLNQPASWWYLGSDDQKHYLLLEKSTGSNKYSVLSSQVRLKVERYNYLANSSKRVKLKLSKIKLIK